VARRPGGKVVFVEGAMPGESVEVRVRRTHRSFDEAVTLRVDGPSPARIEPPCRHVPEGCGGCQWQHIEPSAQITFKEQMVADALSRLGRIARPELAPTVALDPWHFRTTLRVAVKGGRAALRRFRSHELVGIDGCLIVHPLLAGLVDAGRFGEAREVLLRCGARTGERLAAPTPARSRMELPAGVKEDHFHEVASGRTWRVSARSFFQTRPDGLEELVRLVTEAAEEVGPPGRAADLYSGVGVFACALADRGWSVTAVEGSASSVADAEENLRTAPVDIVHGDVRTWPATTAGLVVADPSRDGLGQSGVEVVAATGARRVVLVSCDAAALGRDAGLLSRHGFSLTRATLVDLFPHSFRVEIVSVFDR
jgi:23S rRNA (uracil1939-C5)-methyltransferase